MILFPLMLVLHLSVIGLSMAQSPWSIWRVLIPQGLRWATSRGGLQFSRTYARNPLERRTMEELLRAVSGGLGGKGGKKRRHLKKTRSKASSQFQTITFGEGKGGVRWPGLSIPLDRTKYGTEWLQSSELGIQQVAEGAEVDPALKISLRDLEGEKMVTKRLSETNWSKRGWSGIQWGGRYVGCPEAPDGTPLSDFQSVVIELKRVANQTSGGKRRTVSALVVVGNRNGAAGFAVGKGEETKAAIRKAKNKAVNYLQLIPRCEGHTIYHNIDVKYCRTKILMERRVSGSGLRCQRAISAICVLAGLKNMRAKIVGSTNPLNIVRATFKGLTSQETHQSLADKTGKFLVEYRRECGYRPVVIAVPKSKDDTVTAKTLQSLQLIPRQMSSAH